MAAKQQHPKAGEVVTIKRGSFTGQEFRIEDWYINLTGKPWRESSLAACIEYSIRTADTTPIDDDVLYGHIDGIGHLVHISEVE